MTAWLVVPLAIQGLAMLVDEGVFHRRRGLPRWERIGHPLDTLTMLACLGWLLTVEPGSSHALPVYIALGTFSALFVTKDEPVHTRLCTAGEQWVHSLLFVLHPIVLGAFALLWWTGHTEILVGQTIVAVAFLGYQIVYWNVVVPRRGQTPRPVNNDWYADLGARWYDAQDTPIALLRAEARHRNPWIAQQMVDTLGDRPLRVLDMGCGAGFLSNYLAERGHQVTGVDTTEENLAVARAHDRTHTATYLLADACAVPCAPGSFDVVCAMDLIEHVEDPARLIAEVGRVLAPGGMFFFHTFNRTWQAYLVVIKGVELFVDNAPDDLHVIRLFRTPEEVTAMCRAHGLETSLLVGSRPRFRWPLWRMLLTGKVGDDFAFTFTPSTTLGYTGIVRWSAGNAKALLADEVGAGHVLDR